MATIQKTEPEFPSQQAVNRDTAPQGRIDLEALHSKGIFIIDGHTTDTIPMAEMLAKSGFSNIQTHDQQDTDPQALLLQLLNEQHGIDLILLDITRSGEYGLKLCDTIYQQRGLSSIPLIVIASKGRWQEDSIYSAFRSGATDIVFTPVQRLELIPRVISALYLKMERDLRQHHELELENELAERKVIEARLQYLVSHDELTGLCNRRKLEQALESAVFQARKQCYASALLYIDLDQFKVINDTEGHAVGDRFLMSIANKLRQAITPQNILARISSDEYAILIEDTCVKEAAAIAESLRRTIDEYRFVSNSKKYHIGASIGVALIEHSEDITASETLARAAQACFEAKTHGRNMVHLFSHNDKESHIIRRAVDWVPRIRDAIAHDRLCMHFQPVIDVASGKVYGHEALIRMLDHDGNLISPDNFIPVAERMGLIHDIDLWVINHGIDMLHKLPGQYDHLSLNINLSIYAFQDPALLTLVRDKLAASGVAAQRITFEITETAAAASYAQTRKMINQLRDLGCSFALDDFGSGFSSFNYIKQFPVDYLKIDGSFIRNLVYDPVDQQLVKSMIDVARTLDKKIVAEYVENEEILELLREYGVNLAQGNHIGLPAAAMRLDD
ncbi:MAG: putative bifunctional diguanylate cyclase/phosphodiesterase [Gammaproteobacteria bacterium]